MARDLATLGQGIEQIKASQEQLARDNAHVAEQLKASQEQMARVIAKPSQAKPSQAKPPEVKPSQAASQQNPRPRISAPPPRPTATPMRKPAPAP
jgi:peptidoglycan hydrolase CwlO-like protein